MHTCTMTKLYAWRLVSFKTTASFVESTTINYEPGPSVFKSASVRSVTSFITPSVYGRGVSVICKFWIFWVGVNTKLTIRCDSENFVFTPTQKIQNLQYVIGINELSFWIEASLLYQYMYLSCPCFHVYLYMLFHTQYFEL